MNKKLICDWPSIFEKDLSLLAIKIKEIVSTPALILLDGTLGSGKTTFAKAFCHGETESPTYSILTESEDVLHGDFYRLKESSEITQLELELYLEDKNYFLLEWGKEHFDFIEKELPTAFVSFLLSIAINSDNLSRSFRLYKLSF